MLQALRQTASLQGARQILNNPRKSPILRAMKKFLTLSCLFLIPSIVYPASQARSRGYSRKTKTALAITTSIFCVATFTALGLTLQRLHRKHASTTTLQQGTPPSVTSSQDASAHVEIAPIELQRSPSPRPETIPLETARILHLHTTAQALAEHNREALQSRMFMFTGGIQETTGVVQAKASLLYDRYRNNADEVRKAPRIARSTQALWHYQLLQEMVTAVYGNETPEELQALLHKIDTQLSPIKNALKEVESCSFAP